MEIPITVEFIGHLRSIEWIRKKINFIECEINRKVEKCMKWFGD